MPVDAAAKWTRTVRPPVMLSLSGGGYRGYFTALVLADIEARFGILSHRLFDLIAGTSIGGIIAIGLAQGVPARDIAAMIAEHGQSIFPNLPFPGLRRIFGPPYQSAGLAGVCRKILPNQGTDPLANARTRVVVIGAAPSTARIVPMSSWDLGRTGVMQSIDAALATSAAPTYFPAHQIKLGQDKTPLDVIDGGVAANAPDAIAIHHAVSQLAFPEADIMMLSIGTCATASGAAGPADPVEYGIPAALGRLGGRGIVNLMMAIQEERGISEARSRLGDDRYLRLDKSPAPEQAKILRLDNASADARQTLTELAGKCIDGLDKLGGRAILRHLLARSQVQRAHPS